MKIIGRISKAGNEYWQTAIREEGKTEDTWIPVFLKKGVEKLNFKTMERKLDKRGVAYTLYEVEDKNCFMPPVKDEKDIKKVIITK